MVTLVELEEQTRAQARATYANNKRRSASTVGAMTARRVVHDLLGGSSYDNLTPEQQAVVTGLGFETRSALSYHLASVAEAEVVQRKKANQKVSKTPEGTCQVCFRPDLKAEGGGMSSATLMSLHGFQRPGDGFLYGRCPGARHAPFEQSCERTKAYMKDVEAAAEREEAFVVRLERNEVESLHHEVTDHNLPHNHPNRTKSIEVQRGAPEVGFRYSTGYIPSFEELRQRRLSAAQSKARHLRRHAADLAKRIEAWKPAPLRQPRGVSA